MLRKYEGMFLFDPVVTSDWEAVQAELNRMFERTGARVIACAKWDERRLAYEIRGRKRGIYALTYFEAEPTRVVDLERDVQLSESALRCLILRVDHMSEDEMKEAAAKPAAHPLPEDDRGDRGYRGDRGDRGDRSYDGRRFRGPAPEAAVDSPVEAPVDVEE